MRLKPKHIIFCSEYCRDWNSTRAAIAAGYSQRSARQIASRLLTNDNILNHIAKLENDIQRECSISKLKAVQEYAKIAFSSIADYHNTWIDKKDFEKLSQAEKDCIMSIETRVIGKDVQVKIKLYDKISALNEISKLLGYDAPRKIQHEISEIPKVVIE